MVLAALFLGFTVGHVVGTIPTEEDRETARRAEQLEDIATRLARVSDESIAIAKQAIRDLRDAGRPSMPMPQERLPVPGMIEPPGSLTTSDLSSTAIRAALDLSEACLSVVDIYGKDANGDGCLTYDELHAPSTVPSDENPCVALPALCDATSLLE